jgi:hypothetical protein|tara:strand:- start:156 stop:542 length:387 start_codon:yes stop_codon:yes gene_type:complete
MANSNLRFGVATARYLASDGVTNGAQTLATSSILPIGAAVTRVTLIARGAVAASGSATLTITAGGKSISTAVGKAKLAGAGYIYTENSDFQADTITDDATPIGVTIASGSLTGGTADVDIIVEYALIG